MNIKNFKSDAGAIKAKERKKLECIAKEFELLRTKLHKFADYNGKLSDSEELLELSKQLDELHLEYIRISESQK